MREYQSDTIHLIGLRGLGKNPHVSAYQQMRDFCCFSPKIHDLFALSPREIILLPTISHQFCSHFTQPQVDVSNSEMIIWEK